MDSASVRRRVGDNIRRARWLRGLTIDEAAERVTHPRYLGEIERGRGNITIDTLARLSTRLAVTMSDLVDIDDDPKPRIRLRDTDAAAPRRGPKPNRRGAR